MERLGDLSIGLPTDVTNAGQVKAADELEKTFGPIDIWVKFESSLQSLQPKNLATSFNPFYKSFYKS